MRDAEGAAPGTTNACVLPEVKGVTSLQGTPTHTSTLQDIIDKRKSCKISSAAASEFPPEVR